MYVADLGFEPPVGYLSSEAKAHLTARGQIHQVVAHWPGLQERVILYTEKDM